MTRDPESRSTTRSARAGLRDGTGRLLGNGGLRADGNQQYGSESDESDDSDDSDVEMAG